MPNNCPTPNAPVVACGLQTASPTDASSGAGGYACTTSDEKRVRRRTSITLLTRLAQRRRFEGLSSSEVRTSRCAVRRSFEFRLVFHAQCRLVAKARDIGTKCHDPRASIATDYSDNKVQTHRAARLAEAQFEHPILAAISRYTPPCLWHMSAWVVSIARKSTFSNGKVRTRFAIEVQMVSDQSQSSWEAYLRKPEEDC